MNHSSIPALLLLMVVMYSCKKDKQTDPEIPYGDDNINVMVDASKFSQLKVGNYWIYQEFSIDSLGNATPTPIYDSCYIEKDTIIRGNIYFKIWKPRVNGPPYVPSYIRDSADCILQSEYTFKSDFQIFSCKNFSTPLYSTSFISPPNDTLYTEVTKMTDKNMNVTVPAGTFLTLNAQETYYLNPLLTNKTLRYKNIRFAENVGIVSETANFYITLFTGYTERRLVRYHLN